jgi:hypothetical protein
MIERLVWLGNRRNLTLREPSGDLAIDEVSPEVITTRFRAAVVDLRITELIMADADDEVDFYIQTKLNGNWVDVANVHFDNGDEPIVTANRLICVGPKDVGVVVYTPTDGTLADDTDQDIPVGEALRIKVKLTGATAPTYAYSAKLTMYG